MPSRAPFRFGTAALIPLLLIAGSARAQETGSAPRHSLRSGSWAMEFGVQPSFASGFFGTAGISVKRHLSERLALRIGGAVGVDERQSESTRREFFPSLQVEYDEEADYDAREYTAFAHLQPFVSIQERTAIYLYGGPLIQWVSSTEDENTLLTNGSVITYTRDYDAWSAGLELGAGFEWFWSQRLSLGAYYGISGQYGEFDRGETYYSSQYAPPGEFSSSENGKTFAIRTRGSFFRLAAYF